MKPHTPYQSDNLEALLKEKADEFVLYPSQRVWHSVYNNLHPSKRWPSMATSLLLLFALFLIGHLNTPAGKIQPAPLTGTTAGNQPTQKPESQPHTFAGAYNRSNQLTTTAAVNNSSTPDEVQADLAHLGNPNPFFNGANPQPVPDAIASSHQGSYLTQLNNDDAVRYDNEPPPAAGGAAKATERENRASTRLTATTPYPAEQASGNIHRAENLQSARVDITVDNSGFPAEFVITNAEGQNSVRTNNTPFTGKAVAQPANVFAGTAQPMHLQLQVISALQRQKPTFIQQSGLAITPTAVAGNHLVSHTNELAVRSFMDMDVFYNSRRRNRWKDRLEAGWSIMPMVSYRSLANNSPAVEIGPSNSLPLGSGTTPLNQLVRHRPSAGLELAYQLRYRLMAGVWLKTGIQASYSRYSIQAFDNGHPSSSSITLTDARNNLPYQVFKPAYYSNWAGIRQVNLHNTSLQLTLPIGVDVRLAGNDAVSWNAGVTVQPSLVLAGNNHLLSTDQRYYIHDNSYLNRFNLHAGFETFVAFARGKNTWQIGPQFRRQLFTTNTRLYQVEERLTHVGLRIGVLRRL